MKINLITKSILVILLVWSAGLIFIRPSQAQTDNNVLVLEIEGPVSSAMLNYIKRGIEAAEVQEATALVIQLNTPGGEVGLTRSIVQEILNAKVPVVVYVHPSGGQAASAGTFITLAGHIAVMAPKTSIGAASPVNGQGGDIGETLKSKLENSLIAIMKNLTEQRGEKASKWAQRTITDAVAASAQEALDMGIINFIANDMDDLVAQINGFEVLVNNEPVIIDTTEASITPFEMTPVEQILATFLRPEIAFMLLSIGGLAIVYELASPGGFVSGVIGVICLLLGLYAVGQLPINFAGLGLMILAFILFITEIFAPTHGALTLTGVIALTLGGLLLFDTAEFNYQISIAPVAAVSISLGAIFFFMVTKVVWAMKSMPVSGQEGMLGAIGVAKTALAPTGTVFVDGARWQATVEEGDIGSGDTIEVVSMQGFKLIVRKSEAKK